MVGHSSSPATTKGKTKPNAIMKTVWESSPLIYKHSSVMQKKNWKLFSDLRRVQSDSLALICTDFLVLRISRIEGFEIACISQENRRGIEVKKMKDISATVRAATLPREYSSVRISGRIANATECGSDF